MLKLYRDWKRKREFEMLHPNRFTPTAVQIGDAIWLTTGGQDIALPVPLGVKLFKADAGGTITLTLDLPADEPAILELPTSTP